MRSYFPKLVSGWRKVGGEIGIIVVGVLIALGAEQLVQFAHDRQVASETRQAIAEELSLSLASVALRGQAEPCIDRRLGELRTIFTQWEKSGAFATPQWVAQSPVLDIALTRYDAAVSAGRLSLLPSAQQHRFGAIATNLQRFDQLQNDERLVWGRLRALQAGPAALSATDRTMLRAALQDASTLDYEAKISVLQLLRLAKDYGLSPDFKEVRRLAGRVWTSGRYTPSICTSIDTPPGEANKTQVVPLPL